MLFSWLFKQSRRTQKRRPSRLRLELLERRELLTTVSNLNSSGAGSLSAAIASGGSIDFQAGLNGTIQFSGPVAISSSVSIDAGSNTIFLDGGGTSEIFDISSGGDVSLTGLKFSNASAAEGGAIYNGNGATLSLTDCDFTNNAATNTNWGGGAVANFGALAVDGCSFNGNQGTKGGALWNAAAATSAVIKNSLFSGNTAGHGAAIEDESLQAAQATNDTFQGNISSGADTGVIDTEGSTLTLTNCTVAGNTSGTGSSGAVYAQGGTVQYINTIVADNTGDQFTAGTGGTLTSLGHNISSDGTGNLTGTGDLANTEPQLGPLQNNGGTIDSMAPTAGSHAINAGDNTAANLPATDQRGLPRILNGTIDIGAVEAIEVDTTADNDDGDYGAGKLSLREAIGLAPAGTSLIFDSGLGGGTIDLSAGGGGVGSELDINQNLTIDASRLAGGLTVSGGNAVLVFKIGNVATVTLAGLIIADGNGGGGDGGGIVNSGTLAVNGCTLSDNVATDGAGIYNDGTLSIDTSTFTGNQADQISGVGGALWSDGVSVATVTNSTFTGNSAAYGGAVEYDPITPAQFSNDTFVGNTDTGDDTAIVEADTAAKIDLINCTIANNTSGGPHSAGASAYGGTVQFVNTIVAGNTVAQFISDAGGLTGTLISLGHNISSDGTGNLTAAGDLPNTDPLLAPLANYGGPTSTMALLPGSPAIDAGSDGSAPAQDQRGIARVGQSDIGAFESRGFTMTVDNGNNQTVGVSGAFGLLTVSVASGFGEPVQNGQVTFTPPSTGASASFGSDIAVIDGIGEASATPQANAIAGNYQISATASGVSDPAAFDMTNHGAASLSFIQQPSDVKSGAAMSPGVEVQIFDENRQPFSTTATVTLAANGPGSFISGSTSSVAAVGGLATFNNLAFNAAGTYSLSASLANVPSLASSTFKVSANHLTFTSGPTVAFGGGVNATVAAEDILGRVDTGFQGTIAIGLGTPGGLTGLLTQNAARGTAAFSGLQPTATQLGASLVASTAGLPSVTSGGFNLVLVSGIAPIAVPYPIFGISPNPDADTAEVRGLYRSVLGRDVENVALQYWTAQLAAGVSITATAQALWSSVEHRSDEVDQDYLTLLKRQSDAPGRAAWIAILESTGSETTVAIGMMSSVEYRQLHAGAAAWINAVYNDALGRTPAAQDVNFLVSQIAVGVPFSTIAQVIVNSTESTLRVVGSYYAAMLDRAMKPADAAYWAQDLAATQRGVGSAAVDILGAAEYQDLARNSVR